LVAHVTIRAGREAAFMNGGAFTTLAGAIPHNSVPGGEPPLRFEFSTGSR
jgi:hypothetical protein